MRVLGGRGGPVGLGGTTEIWKEIVARRRRKFSTFYW
jgi:hypothetical protein